MNCKSSLLCCVEHDLHESRNDEKERLQAVQASDTVLSIVRNEKRQCDLSLLALVLLSLAVTAVRSRQCHNRSASATCTLHSGVHAATAATI